MKYPDIDKPPLGVVIDDAVIDPRFYVSLETGSDAVSLLLFDANRGWVTYLLPLAQAVQLHHHLQQQIERAQSLPPRAVQ